MVAVEIRWEPTNGNVDDIKSFNYKWWGAEEPLSDSHSLASTHTPTHPHAAATVRLPLQHDPGLTCSTTPNWAAESTMTF